MQSCNPDRKSTRLNSSHLVISYAVFCLKKKKNRFTSIDLFTTPHETAYVLITIRYHHGARTQEWAGGSPRYFHLDSPRFFFFFNDTATTEIYTLSLHDALPI